jgi:hypothetical protein
LLKNNLNLESLQAIIIITYEYAVQFGTHRGIEHKPSKVLCVKPAKGYCYGMQLRILGIMGVNSFAYKHTKWKHNQISCS